ncbi:MAG: thiolase domain-containing protein [Candidatus Woesearchaeota archaeon]|jgi:acetyl-CoA C-acetyltransferase|nr:thiolase domain-containing protein [Candidatus Woesearchaeota archaeon]|tara:strand:+ start:457 stop:1584 length:1128 start_codon:yes stop_codon:yes gene_type:complete
MYIKGVGMTKFGIHTKTTQELCYESIMDALDDAEISLSDIDEIIISKGDSANDGERQRLFPGVLSSILQDQDIPIIRVIAACSGGGAAVWNAVNSRAKNILVIGVEKLTPAPTRFVTDDLMMASERLYEQTEGLNFPAQNALIAQQYMMKYNVSQKDLALVSLKSHENAFHNPKARFYKKKITMDMIKKSPIVASPLRLLDCSISVDGAAAAIISKEKSNIEIIGSSLYADRLPAFESKDMTTWEGTRLAVKSAYNQAGINPEDVDFVELHDAFTPVELMAYEDLGFAEKGEGKKLIKNGATKINGTLPVNTSGGLKAKGHPISATGISQIYEIVKQMRGQAGKRQLNKTKIGLAHNVGGVGSTVTVNILKHIGG